jgi:PDZ domain-containing protein
VAFKRLGLDVEIIFGDIIVEELVCEEEPTVLSACRVLNPGDTLVAFNGVEVVSLRQLSEMLAPLEPGDVVTLKIVPHKKSTLETRRVELIASLDNPNRTIIGFVPADTRTVNLPFEVDINTESIGGPSAGLAFTLALLDELTPGSLAGEVKVAATGTITDDESVGAIGALRQKTVAAKRAGAQVFLVPSEQSADELAAARAVAGTKMRIVTVANLEEALTALEKLGGSGLTNAALKL